MANGSGITEHRRSQNRESQRRYRQRLRERKGRSSIDGHATNIDPHEQSANATGSSNTPQDRSEDGEELYSTNSWSLGSGYGGSPSYQDISETGEPRWTSCFEDIFNTGVDPSSYQDGDIDAQMEVRETSALNVKSLHTPPLPFGTVAPAVIDRLSQQPAQGWAERTLHICTPQSLEKDGSPPYRSCLASNGSVLRTSMPRSRSDQQIGRDRTPKKTILLRRNPFEKHIIGLLSEIEQAYEVGVSMNLLLDDDKILKGLDWVADRIKRAAPDVTEPNG